MKDSAVYRAIMALAKPGEGFGVSVARFAVVCGVSSTSARNMLVKGYLTRGEHALAVADATAKAGKPVTVRELCTPPKLKAAPTKRPAA